MKEKTKWNDYDALPLILDVTDIQHIMGISRASAYELVHTPGFPAVRSGRLIKVSKPAFFACPNYHNTVTRLKWLTGLTVDPQTKRRMLELARKMETEMSESWYNGFYHHLRMEMVEYRCLKRSLRVLKNNTDYEEDLYDEAV